MSKSLFEEAIADAKQLRSVAEQNAKNAIIEAVTPKIKEFIEKELAGETTSLSDSNNFLMSSLNENDDDEGMLISPHQAKAQVKEEQEEDEIELNETALKSLIDLLGTKKMSENDRLREAFNMLSEDEQGSILELVKGTMHTDDDEDVHEIDLKPKNTKQVTKSSGDTNMKKDTLYELDFDDLNEDKITIDFGKDVKFDRENPYSVIVDDSEEEDEDVTLEEPPEEEESEDMGDMDAELPPMEDEEPPAAAEGRMFEIDEAMLRRELLRLREARKQKEDKLLSKKSLKSASHVKAAAKAFGDATIEEVDEVEINALDNAKKHKLKNLKESRDNRELVTQLNEYRSAVETLREQMTDMNLFNAKLLYVNKMLQSKELTPKQQKVVIEAIDGASTLREVKMLYKSLTESLTGGNGATLSESASRFNAGGSSRATSSSAARPTETAEVDRWAKLAGLK